MAANNDNWTKLPWSPESTAYGILQLKREEAERIEAQKSDADRFHEQALRRFFGNEPKKIRPKRSRQTPTTVARFNPSLYTLRFFLAFPAASMSYHNQV